MSPVSSYGIGLIFRGHLPAHWARLDVFEGHGYQRVVTTVDMPTGDIDAYIYVLLQLQD